MGNEAMKEVGRNEYKSRVAAALEARGWAMQAVEDSQCRYIPDLAFSANGVGGWIEVKFCQSVPTNLDAIKHYTKGQEMFLRRHGEKGSGHCYLLVGIAHPETHVLVRWDALKEARLSPFGFLLSMVGVRQERTLDELAYFMNKHINKR